MVVEVTLVGTAAVAVVVEVTLMLVVVSTGSLVVVVVVVRPTFLLSLDRPCTAGVGVLVGVAFFLALAGPLALGELHVVVWW